MSRRDANALNFTAKNRPNRPGLARLLFILSLIAPLHYAAAQQVTIDQLRDFLLAQHRSKHPDSETADRLSSVSLSERLTDPTLNQIVSDTAPGPESLQQLRLLADASIFAPPPAAEIPALPAPAPDQQQVMLTAAAGYAQTALRHLPDFLAVRHTIRYDNRPMPLDPRHSKPRIQLHWIGEFKDQIAYRHGAEIAEDPTAQATSPQMAIHPGLHSIGEFGPILSLVFGDFHQGSITWSRWETDPILGRLAVFHYTVPKSVSHYLVDFCCYTTPEDENRELSFQDHPAYHGEVILDPDSGAVRRITIEADLDPSAPVISSQLAVEYGDIEIGGRSYVCPIRSLADITLHNYKMERIDGIGIERHLNEIQYLDYHKFGSSSRMLTNP